MAIDRLGSSACSRRWPAATRRRALDPSGAAVDDAVRAVLDEQIEAGLGLLTDGSVRWPDPLRAVGRALLPEGSRLPHRSGPLSVDAWSFAQEVAAPVPVKQCLPGPYTLGPLAGGRSPAPGAI